ncbi:serine/threonine protein kinase [Nannocystis pusilla]|uniref:Protein kinase domain-containing protein n=1 Tax=Nannocystis pusilla TaxID=889268 RepID=A0ABS7TP28_9BACT|nr:hypothetical protein [Nannocystis pusilla]MBZ5709986.1 hypothetical protein [Nannocystis pusilla]
MSASFAPRVGDRVANRYKLTALLRGGGAAQVFRAQDGGSEVDLVLIDPARCEPEAWASFAQLVEFTTAAQIPGLSPLHGITEAPPTPPHCLAEAQVGRGFDRLRADEGPLPWQRGLALGEQVAAILEAVDATIGLAHRALIPARCTVDAQGQVKLLDYGIAEFEPLEGRPDESGYRAPEQASGPGDAASDIFSLALILFELVAGVRPPTTMAPRLRSLVPEAPQAVDDFFAAALARDPELRLPDVSTMRAALRELLGLGPAPAVEASQSPAPPPAAVPASTAAPSPPELPRAPGSTNGMAPSPAELVRVPGPANGMTPSPTSVRPPGLTNSLTPSPAKAPVEPVRPSSSALAGLAPSVVQSSPPAAAMAPLPIVPPPSATLSMPGGSTADQPVDRTVAFPRGSKPTLLAHLRSTRLPSRPAAPDPTRTEILPPAARGAAALRLLDTGSARLGALAAASDSMARADRTEIFVDNKSSSSARADRTEIFVDDRSASSGRADRTEIFVADKSSSSGRVDRTEIFVDNKSSSSGRVDRTEIFVDNKSSSSGRIDRTEIFVDNRSSGRADRTEIFVDNRAALGGRNERTEILQPTPSFAVSPREPEFIVPAVEQPRPGRAAAAPAAPARPPVPAKEPGDVPPATGAKLPLKVVLVVANLVLLLVILLVLALR